MPLRAILGDQELFAPLLSDKEWEELTQKKVKVILPCCNSIGYLVTPKEKIRHFRHNKKDGCSYKPEGQEHLLCKLEIAKACKAMGYEVKTEAHGEDWIADVLATKIVNNQLVQVAFEVQCSPQTLEKTEQRQQKYIRDGIRCCWLFKKLPTLQPRQNIPMFPIQFDESTNPTVIFNKNSLTISNFVNHWLADSFKFCQFYRYKTEQQIVIRFFPVNCWKCHKEYYIYDVKTQPYETVCGFNKLIYPTIDDIQFVPEIRDKASKYFNILKAQNQNIEMGKIKTYYIKKARSSQISFGCPDCNAIFGKGHYPQAIRQAKSKHQNIDFETTVNISLENKDIPHWCYSPTQDFCCR